MLGDWSWRLRTILFRRGFLASVLVLVASCAVVGALISAARLLGFSPLPQPEPERLAVVWEGLKDQRESPRVTSLGLFLHAQEQLADLALFTVSRPLLPTLRLPDQSLDLKGSMVSRSFLEVLGISPIRGRDFIAKDLERRDDIAVIISHDLWLKQFAGIDDLADIDFQVEIGGPPIRCQVVGVLAATPSISSPFIAWDRLDILLLNPLPPNWRDQELRYLARRSYRLTARLHEEENLPRLRLRLDALVAALGQQHPRVFENFRIEAHRAGNLIVEPYLKALKILGLLALLVLAGACTNIAILIIARHQERARELALRVVLGAGPWQVARRLLQEALAPALIALLPALLLAHGIVSGLGRFSSSPRLQSLSITAPDAALLALILVIMVCLFTLPAWLTQHRRSSALRLDPAVMPQISRRSRRPYVIFQMLVAVLILTASLAMLQQLRQVLLQDLGFEPRGVITLELKQLPAGNSDPLLYQRAAEAVAALAEVQSAGIVRFVPMADPPVTVQAGGDDDLWRQPVQLDGVGPDAFSSLGIPLLQGRPPEVTDLGAWEADQPPMWISESLAQQLAPGPVVGRSIPISLSQSLKPRIAGVVGDVHRFSALKSPVAGVYLPFTRLGKGRHRLVLRTALSDLERVAARARQTVDSLHHGLVVGRGTPVGRHVLKAAEPQRLMAIVASLLVALALTLSIAGITATTLDRVSKGRHDAAIRNALGASPGRARRQLTQPIFTDCLIGIALGGLLTAAYGDALMKFFWPQGPALGELYLHASSILIAVTVASIWIASSDLGRLEPAAVLRRE